MNLLNVLPTTTVDDARDSCSVYSEPFGNHSLQCTISVHATHLTNIIVGKVCQRMTTTSIRAGTLWSREWSVVAAFARHIVHVVALSAEEKMIRPYAGWIVATVADMQSGRYLPVVQHPRDTMRGFNAAHVCTSAIAEHMASSGPFPASVTLSDARPEPLNELVRGILAGHRNLQFRCRAGSIASAARRLYALNFTIHKPKTAVLA